MIQVDIILITYNQDRFVSQAINSILNQNIGEDWSVRVIVADDASTDGTLTLIKNRVSELYDKGWTVIFLPSSSNLGHVHNYKRAFSKCNGDYVAILEGDDWWCSPNHLKRHVTYLQAHEECVGSSQFPLMFQEETKLYGIPKILDYDSSKICMVDTKMEIRTNMIWNLSSFVVRTQCLKKLPDALFEVGLLDWPMYICLSTQGNIVLQPGYSSVYRVNDKGIWSAGAAEKKCQMLVTTLKAAEQLIGDEYSDDFNSTIKNLYPSQSFKKRISAKIRKFLKLK